VTATRSFSKSADEALLDEFATLMNVANLFGAEADAENTNAQRVVWIPAKWNTSKLAVQPVDGVGIRQHDRRYTVAIYSDNYGGLIELYHALYRALDARSTLQAFDFGEGEPKGGSGGWGIAIPVTLKGPIYSEVHAPVVIESTSQALAVGAEGDSAPAEDL
jgi:hypothetical protein